MSANLRQRGTGVVCRAPAWVLGLLVLGCGCFLVLGMALLALCFKAPRLAELSLPEPLSPWNPPAAFKAGQREVAPAAEAPAVEAWAPETPPANENPAPVATTAAEVERTPPASAAQPAMDEEATPPVPTDGSDHKLSPERPVVADDDGIKFIPGPLVVPPRAGEPRYRIHTRPHLQQGHTRPLRLAVTPAQYDDMGRLLAQLGDGYRFTPIREADLANLKKLTEFDVVFLTCATTGNQDLRAVSALRRYVELGGTLYASDLRFDLVARAFPEKVLRRPLPPGRPQPVRATVLDPGLRQLLGPGIVLDFASPGWRPAGFEPSKVKTFIEGSYVSQLGQPLVAPLLVKFPCQKGSVIFTSFHNAAQNNEVQQRLLQHLVFTAINARTEALAHKAMLLGGFAPRETRNLTIADETARVQFVYELRKSTAIQFAVGFAAQGAKVRLQIEAPSGARIEHADSTTFIMELPAAAAGEWRCTVTAPAAPFANFPFTLIVGEGTGNK